MQKFSRGLLLGLLGLFAVLLLIFFVVMFMAAGQRGMNVGDDRMWKKNIRPWQEGVEGSARLDRDMMEGTIGVPSTSGDRLLSQKMMPGSEGVPVESGSASLEERRIIKNGSLDIRVQSADEALERIRVIALEQGGVITDSNFTQGTDALRSGTVTVKVPVANFDATLYALKQVATLVVNESISGTDATDWHMDLSARLKNKRAQEAALQDILNRAEKVSDIIEITNALGTVRGEIESLEGQLRSLEAQTDRATITLFVMEDTRVTGDQAFRPGQTFTESLQALLRGLGHLMTGIIALVIIGIPLLLIYGLMLWGIFLSVRKFMRRIW